MCNEIFDSYHNLATFFIGRREYFCFGLYFNVVLTFLFFYEFYFLHLLLVFFLSLLL